MYLAAGWILSGEDYITRLTFEWASITFEPALVISLDMYTHERYIHFNFWMKLNINSIYTVNFWILSLYVLIDPWIHCPTEKLLTCSISCPTVWPGVENRFGAENWMDYSLAITSLLTSLSLSSQLVGR